MWQSRNMAARDGDGWIQCQCGSKHWGKFGAAGILIFRENIKGGREIFLQHRAPWVHNGDTWGIPGGAKDSHESVKKLYIGTTWLLLISNIVYIFYMIRMFRVSESIDFKNISSLPFVTIALWSLGLAIYGMVRTKNKHPLINLIKVVN